MFAKGLCLVAFVSLAACGASLGGGRETGDDVLKKIQGTWQFISQEIDGKPNPKEVVMKAKITFTDDKWTVRIDGDVVQAGTHKFDPSKKPGQVDAKVTEGEGKGTTMLGIYELKGNTMKVCFDQAGKARPTGFNTKEGQFSAVVQRDKKQ